MNLYCGMECFFDKKDLNKDVALELKKAGELLVAVKLCGEFCRRCQGSSACVVLRKLRQRYFLSTEKNEPESDNGRRGKSLDSNDSNVIELARADNGSYVVVDMEEYKARKS